MSIHSDIHEINKQLDWSWSYTIAHGHSIAWLRVQLISRTAIDDSAIIHQHKRASIQTEWRGNSETEWRGNSEIMSSFEPIARIGHNDAALWQSGAVHLSPKLHEAQPQPFQGCFSISREHRAYLRPRLFA